MLSGGQPSTPPNKALQLTRPRARVPGAHLPAHLKPVSVGCILASNSGASTGPGQRVRAAERPVR